MKNSNAFSCHIKLTIEVSAFSKKYSWDFWCISRSSLGSCIWCCCGCGRRCCYCVTGDLFLLCQKKLSDLKNSLYFSQRIWRSQVDSSIWTSEIRTDPDRDMSKSMWNCGIRNHKSCKLCGEHWFNIRIFLMSTLFFCLKIE